MKKKIETIEIGNREFDVKNHTYVMGILNVTPDSFSDGGKYDQLDRALFHAEPISLMSVENPPDRDIR